MTRLGGGFAWWIWSLAVAFVVYTFSFQTGYSIVNSAVQKDAGLSVSQVATIAAVYTWAFAFCQFFGGALLDRLGSRKVLPISIALVTVGVFVFANANSYGMLLLSQIIVAIGSCTAFVGAGYIGGQWFGMAKFSFMFGLVSVCSALTSSFALNLFEAVLGSITWRTLFNTYGVIGIVLLVLSAVYVRNPVPVAGGVGTGIGPFVTSVMGDLVQVGKIGHVWIASIIGAAQFGVMLALGVVWMPKLLMVHGLSQSAAGFVSSLLWLGSAAGSAALPAWSDHLERRKQPMIQGSTVTLTCLLALLYVPNIERGLAIILCLTLGFASASNMLAFSTVADVVKPSQIGTSAAIVNGITFLVGGILISRPGMRIGVGIDAGIEPESLALAQYASRPLLAALALALALTFYMKETYPKNVALRRGDQALGVQRLPKVKTP
jgi:MFS family permease